MADDNSIMTLNKCKGRCLLDDDKSCDKIDSKELCNKSYFKEKSGNCQTCNWTDNKCAESTDKKISCDACDGTKCTPVPPDKPSVKPEEPKNILDKYGDNLGAYMWILPGVLSLILFMFNIKIKFLKIFIWIIILGSTAFIFYYTKTHETAYKSLKDNYSNFFVNKWFPQYMFENDKKNKNNNTSKVSNIVASVIYYLICLIPTVFSLLLIMWPIRIARYKYVRYKNCR